MGKLTVVNEDTPAPEAPKTVKAAAEHSERALLVSLRTKIATDIDAGVPPAYLAPLARQLREIDRDIRAMDARDEQEVARRGDGVTRKPFDATAI